MKKVSAVIFDLDGTLIDSFPGIEFSITKAIESVIPDAPVPDLRKWIGPPIREILLGCFKDLQEDKLEEMVRIFRSSYDNEGCYQVRAFPDVADTLSKINNMGILCFITTNKPTLPTQNILEYQKLNNYFKQIVCKDSRYPPFDTKAQMVVSVLDKNHLLPDTTILVGDMPGDADAARHSHLIFAWARYGYGRDVMQDTLSYSYVIDSINDLILLCSVDKHDHPALENQFHKEN
jgi:phosphoglycolate phosphatase